MLVVGEELEERVKVLEEGEEVEVVQEESEEHTEAAGGAGEARPVLGTSGHRWGTLHRVITTR